MKMSLFGNPIPTNLLILRVLFFLHHFSSHLLGQTCITKWYKQCIFNQKEHIAKGTHIMMSQIIGISVTNANQTLVICDPKVASQPSLAFLV